MATLRRRGQHRATQHRATRAASPVVQVLLLRQGQHGRLCRPQVADDGPRARVPARRARGVQAVAHVRRAQGVGGHPRRRARQGREGGTARQVPHLARGAHEGARRQALPQDAALQRAAQKVQGDDRGQAQVHPLRRRRDLCRGAGVVPHRARLPARARLRTHRDDRRRDDPDARRHVDWHRGHAPLVGRGGAARPTPCPVAMCTRMCRHACMPTAHTRGER